MRLRQTKGMPHFRHPAGRAFGEIHAGTAVVLVVSSSVAAAARLQTGFKCSSTIPGAHALCEQRQNDRSRGQVPTMTPVAGSR